MERAAIPFPLLVISALDMNFSLSETLFPPKNERKAARGTRAAKLALLFVTLKPLPRRNERC